MGQLFTKVNLRFELGSRPAFLLLMIVIVLLLLILPEGPLP